MTTDEEHDTHEGRVGDLIERYTDYAADQNIALNPDTTRVEAVIKGLLKREAKHGAPYCPCRVLTGDAKDDEKHVCPCAYHLDEIARDGHCLCRLFVAPHGDALCSESRLHEPT